MRRSVSVFLLIATVAAGCGGRSSGSSATRAAQCERLAGAFCARASRGCQLFPVDQMDECLQSAFASCCSGSCGQSAVITEDDFATCIADIDAATCGTLDLPHGGSLPPSCVRVVRSMPAD